MFSVVRFPVSPPSSCFLRYKRAVLSWAAAPITISGACCESLSDMGQPDHLISLTRSRETQVVLPSPCPAVPTPKSMRRRRCERGQAARALLDARSAYPPTERRRRLRVRRGALTRPSRSWGETMHPSWFEPPGLTDCTSMMQVEAKHQRTIRRVKLIPRIEGGNKSSVSGAFISVDVHH